MGLKQINSTWLYTSVALIAFAANSILCRLALKDEAIDPSSFTSIRLLSGVVMFIVLLAFPRNGKKHNMQLLSFSGKNFLAAGTLFIYAIGFSYAYITLDTGTGALILFGTVQLTMIGIGFIRGEKLHVFDGAGIFIAFGGLIYLLYPTISTPNMSGALYMVIAGVAWGVYTVLGRASAAPLTDTANNFIWTMPLVIVLFIFTVTSANITVKGAFLAVLSGAFASALGYSVWYKALNTLGNIQAAVLQLSVPVIAAIGGVLFVFESITIRLMLSSLMVLGGILLVILRKSR
ncbi:DMT family transporter [Thalassotalea litorea]|uniref:DMT family transporter n=1 Tax=Thalassotalea litorea TaxID=2020715 RepID=A0A5R9IF11_9GAMM|nr:DMT family transporter [Thalassotalea litorea]TLU64084.1 DMT family transporter [Thalassotalea litorea]